MTTMMTFDEETTRIINLPQITQQTDEWFVIRRNKQSASDFGAVVPRTSKYIQHIVDRWDSDDLKKKRVTHCYSFGPDEYYLNKVHYDVDSTMKVPTSSGWTSKACKMGHQFEPVVRELTKQHLNLSIIELGWIEGQHTPHAGVSPDGLVIDSSESETATSSSPHWYWYDTKTSESDKMHANNNAGFMHRGPKNFEAKTIVSRKMDQKVPLKYHIQVERTAYELGVQSSIYSEAQCTLMHMNTWLEEIEKFNKNIPHQQFGIMLLCRDQTYKYAPTTIITPQQFIDWSRDASRDGDLSIYFRVDAFWCVEIPLWSEYHDVYGPLIRAEAEKLHWFATTPDGHLAYNNLRREKVVRQEAYRKKRLMQKSIEKKDIMLDIETLKATKALR